LLAMVLAAVALKVAVVAPAATVTEAGTVSKVLLLPRVTAEPPAGAVRDSVIVHVLAPPPFRAEGAQFTGNRDGAVIVPLTADVIANPFPTASTPIGFDIGIEALVAPGASVAFT
jgi:hypothetical protein